MMSKTTTKELNRVLKDALFDFLEKHEIPEVTVEYDGSGDEGSIQEIEMADANRERNRILGTFRVLNGYRYEQGGGMTPIYEDRELTAEGAIEQVCYDTLSTPKYQGWEISSGAYGTFSFDVANRKIRLEHNERYEEVTTSEEEL